MVIDILTLFPEMFNLFDYSIVGRAKEKGIVDITPSKQFIEYR